MNEMSTKTSNKRDCTVGDGFLAKITLSSNFIILSLLFLGLYIFKDQNYKFKTLEVLSYISGLLGASLFLTGLVLSAVYLIMRFNSPKGGFGLFYWIGGFLCVWSILLGFMQKVG